MRFGMGIKNAPEMLTFFRDNVFSQNGRFRKPLGKGLNMLLAVLVESPLSRAGQCEAPRDTGGFFWLLFLPLRKVT